MALLESFKVDHTKMKAPAVRLSKRYETPHHDVISVFDLRFCIPNQEMMPPKGMHTLEHLFAGFMRTHLNSDRVEIIDISPMGCRTGCYFLTRGLTDAEVLDCVVKSFEFMAHYDGEIPGAKVEECGNYQDHDLKGCNEEATKYVEVLKKLTPDDMKYSYYLD